ncbi:hypothetical protein H6G89_19710 [Oscillatoria sp. FACHB-1407]|uniref:hypothetical protein n=1 Tax=Oscillatoria sp. FACHB-1407 TaxID=2692847 RepID=UPI001681E93E|nr:hypothetical protein [Oscillatoria sp. FACHB-1407]MBD2463265.1 hypothetical protein [Oscillatoria sp. FACHB-1407]
MTRAVDQIERDIAALEQAVVAIAQDLHTTYEDYLTDLGQAVKRQLVLAAYHICTQGYPDRFLQLSLSQRQELQQTLKQLAQQAQTQLMSRLKAFDDFSPIPEEESKEDDESEDEFSYEELTDDLTDEELAEELAKEDLLHEAVLFTSEFAEPPLAQGDRLSERDHAQAGDQAQAELSKPPAEASESPASKLDAAQVMSNPKLLLSWQESMEKGIVAVLQTLSYTANRLLQQSDILPSKLPEPILEVAAKAGAEIASGPPNLLNLLIEAESDSNSESRMTHIMTIRLRLSEIEFADATLGAWRSKIRGLLARLNQLGRDYQKKHKEKAIATAEAAWRSTWFDE